MSVLAIESADEERRTSGCRGSGYRRFRRSDAVYPNLDSRGGFRNRDMVPLVGYYFFGGRHVDGTSVPVIKFHRSRTDRSERPIIGIVSDVGISDGARNFATAVRDAPRRKILRIYPHFQGIVARPPVMGARGVRNGEVVARPVEVRTRSAEFILNRADFRIPVGRYRRPLLVYGRGRPAGRRYRRRGSERREVPRHAFRNTEIVHISLELPGR